MRRDLILCLLLAGITLVLYWPVRTFDLIANDDPAFLLNQPEIRSGLNGHSLPWALTGVVAANWHPVTNLSFVLGHQLWGLNPGAEHLVNAVFHALNAALLFLVMVQLTRSSWRSAVVAALFAWHPLRVESVAWIAERKDVLSVFFFLLTLLCYASFAQKSEVRSQKPEFGNPASGFWLPASGSYWLAVTFFALGLMSKAMLVTLPFVLVLLDFWPLRRISDFGFRTSDWKTKLQPSTLNPQLSALLFEKWPFFGLTAVLCVVTFLVQRENAATPSLAVLSLGLRLENVIVSYLRYLAWTIWPANLALFYSFPFDDHFYLALWPGWQIGAAAAVLVLTSILCVRRLGQEPYLAVGWFWYLGTIVPVIGLVQIGGQGMADRYTYIPLIGPVISLVWLVADKWPARILPRPGLALLTTALLVAAWHQTRHQLGFWQNAQTVAQHTVEVTKEDPRAEYLLGLRQEQRGDFRGALIHYRNAATSLTTVAEAYSATGRLLARFGRWAEAEKIYAVLLQLKPDDFTSHLGLATVLPHLGQTAEAARQLEAARQTCPDAPDALNNLAWVLATSEEAELRDGAQAVRYAERACEQTRYQEIIPMGTLAAAYAEAGRFDAAVATAQKACDLAGKQGETQLQQRNQELLERYRARQPWRE